MKLKTVIKIKCETNENAKEIIFISGISFKPVKEKCMDSKSL